MEGFGKIDKILLSPPGLLQSLQSLTPSYRMLQCFERDTGGHNANMFECTTFYILVRYPEIFLDPWNLNESKHNMRQT